MKEIFTTLLKLCVSIGFLVMGIVQYFAIYVFFRDYLDWHWLFCALPSLILAAMPLIGSIFGMIGATTVWDWSWLQAGLLFFWWPVLFLVIYGAGGIKLFIEFLKDKMVAKKEIPRQVDSEVVSHEQEMFLSSAGVLQGETEQGTPEDDPPIKTTEQTLPDDALSAQGKDNKDKREPFGIALICVFILILLGVAIGIYTSFLEVQLYLPGGEFWEFVSSPLYQEGWWGFVLTLSLYQLLSTAVFIWLAYLFIKRKHIFIEAYIMARMLFIIIDWGIHKVGLAYFNIRIFPYFPIDAFVSIVFLIIIGLYLTKSERAKAVFIN